MVLTHCCKDNKLGAGRRSPTEQCQPVNVTGDSFFSAADRTCFFFSRSLPGAKTCSLGPRLQINQMTHYIDLSEVYGNSKKASNELRTRKGGRMDTSAGPNNNSLLPDDKESVFKIGDRRSLVTPAAAALTILMVRKHNSICAALQKLNPHWSDEVLFQESRRVMVALFQQITYKEFLPVILDGSLMEEHQLRLRSSGHSDSYSQRIDASTLDEFSVAAFRLPHVMIREKFLLRNKKSMSLLRSFSRIGSLRKKGTLASDFLDGLAKLPAKYPDTFMPPTLHNHFAASPESPVGLDLMAMTIKRGRDHGIPAYIKLRAVCQLKTFKNFDQLREVMPERFVDLFKTLYKEVDDVDLFPAGLAEFKVGRSLLGPTFSCIIGKQFSSLKHGDWFWFENRKKIEPFTPDQLTAIRKVSMASIMCSETTIASLQPNPFMVPDKQGNEERPCSEYPKLDLSSWKESSSTPQKEGPFFSRFLSDFFSF